MNAEQLIKTIETKKLKPIYLLMGDEDYYIDQITDAIIENGLAEEERSFNQNIFYGKDVKTDDIISAVKRYPMMAPRQIVVVREAQHVKNIENLEGLCENPVPTTVLVLAIKGSKIDQRKKWVKALKKNGEVFIADRIKESKVSDWIEKEAAKQNLRIGHKASAMLAEYVGENLVKISNEFSKLKILIPAGSEITPEIIESNIGVSKDYNIFELQNAFGARDIVKANKIAAYYGKNQKTHHIQVVLGALYGYFSRLLMIIDLRNKRKDVAKETGMSPYWLKHMEANARNYSLKKLVEIIGLLAEYDLKSKGVNNKSATAEDLLKELVYKILH